MKTNYIPSTPGPWHTDAGKQVNGAGLHIAYIQDAPGLGFAAEANEALRDAAPCLLKELLEIVENEAENIDPARLFRARAVIDRTRRPYPKRLKQPDDLE